MNIPVAIAAIEEARLLATTGGQTEEITDALELALRILQGETITDADLDHLHPAVAHRLRDHGHP